MKNHRLAYILSLLLLPTLVVWAQKAELLPQYNLAKWNVKPANYSGITWLGNDLYAMVDDKSELDGFYLINININKKNGKIKDVRPQKFVAKPAQNDAEAKLRKIADCEDLVYVPETQTVFINSEHDAQVREYDMQGNPTGRALQLPPQISKQNQVYNGGFEALGYHPATKTFWLTTENSLKSDTKIDNSQPLRIISFDHSLIPTGEWAYLMDAPQLTTDVRFYTHGVSAVTALSDGRLLIMERELSIPSRYLGGQCNIQIYIVAPSKEQTISNIDNIGTLQPTQFLQKQLVASFHTTIKIGALNYANYEGMCLGPTLQDGRQTLLLICDSQAGAGNSIYKLKDYIKVILLDKEL